MSKIVFLDEYSVAGRDLQSIIREGEYIAYNNTTKDQVVERLKDADIAITNKVLIDGEAMRQLPNLKLICVAATGMNNVDLETARELGIVVKNAVGYSTTSVAETTLASALALARNIVYFDEYYHDGRYAKADRAFCYDRLTFEIRGKKWGIIGLGNIGREVARLATAFGCEVRYFSTSGVKREEGYPSMELNELLEWSDIVSVHSPLNERTRGLVGREELKVMKPTAAAMVAEGCPFTGVLYGGLMKTPQGPKVIEFNCRFGDPETEVVLPRLESDIYDIFSAVADNTPMPEIKWSENVTMGFVMASKGYPGDYEKGYEIKNLDNLPENIRVFHMGTSCKDGKYYTSGGRVLMVVGFGADLQEAHDKALAAVESIECDNLFYRRDIGWRVL